VLRFILLPASCYLSNEEQLYLLFCKSSSLHVCSAVSVQSTGKRGRRGGGAGRDVSARKKVRADPGDGEGSLFEIVKSGKTALNVRTSYMLLLAV